MSVETIDSLPQNMHAASTQAFATSRQSSFREKMSQIDANEVKVGPIDAFRTEHPELFAELMTFWMEDIRKQNQKSNDRVIEEIKKQNR